MKKKSVISIIIFVIGMLALVAGVIFLVINLNKGPAIQDGEFLVEKGEWALSDGTNCVSKEAAEEETNCLPSVIWNFTEIGKGTLTTNGHIDDHEFIWALEDGKLKIETDWLYTLENEYTYTLDQENNALILKADDATYTFIAR